jgi:hypothetical protein
MRLTGRTEKYISYGIAIGSGMLALLFFGCAKVGAPTGGLKDTNPPVYIEAEPANGAVNFTGDEVNISFDEYITLKDQNREVILSPPMKKKPVIRVVDNSIRVVMNEELLPQTTYTLNFGNAIADNNEGNVLPDFEFVFSTGSKIDSLSVTGKAVNASDRKPLKEGGVLVMLYRNLADSAPLLEIPKYIGRTSKSGLFSINNLPADTFRLLAVTDANNNLMYDPGSESVAFMDTFLIINSETVSPVTFIKDTVKIIHPATKTGRSGKQAESREADTTIAPGKKLNAMDVSLFYSLEETNAVFVDSKKRDVPEKLTFTFSRPPHDSVKLTPLNFKPGHDWYLLEASGQGDTLAYWITDTLISSRDTLDFTLAYLTTDSAGRFVTRTDTVILKMQRNAEPGNALRRNRNVAPVLKKKVLTLTPSIAERGMQHLNRPIVITAERPLKKFDPERIELYRIKDTLTTRQSITVMQDSFNLRSFRIGYKWQESSQYRLILLPGASEDIYGLTNDSLMVSFTTQREDYYGRILANVRSDEFPLILQLLDSKEKLVKSQYIKESGVVVFDYLSPGKYLFKVIYDKNENRLWDTGNYLKHIQPEKVYFYPLPKDLRSNWDVETTLVVSD